MNELIRIGTNEQGSQIVSARELYGFLEIKSRFNDWIKNRIIKYGFLENEDYETLTKILVSGGTETDYALSLDMAKELSMVERNAKGKAARQYFIEAEKQLRQVVTAIAKPELTTEQVLLQQAHALVEQQSQISQLRADVAQLMAGSKPHREPVAQLPTVAAINHRQAISHRVSEYCKLYGVSPSETYSYLYRRLNEVYRINVYRLNRGNGGSILDAIERHGHLDRLYALLMADLALPNESSPLY